MSARLMVKVKHCDVGNAIAKYLLLLLAEHAKDDGTSVHPGIPLLIRDSHLKRRTIQYALRRLEKLKLIVTNNVESQHYTTRYSINVEEVERRKFPNKWSATGQRRRADRDSLFSGSHGRGERIDNNVWGLVTSGALDEDEARDIIRARQRAEKESQRRL